MLLSKNVAAAQSVIQDGSGWTPLMIASSLREGDEVVDLLLGKEADVNGKSVFLTSVQIFKEVNKIY